jgi:hypothetical protein
MVSMLTPKRSANTPVGSSCEREISIRTADVARIWGMDSIRSSLGEAMSGQAAQSVTHIPQLPNAPDRWSRPVKRVHFEDNFFRQYDLRTVSAVKKTRYTEEQTATAQFSD